jgi:hypothetical protein
LARSSPAIGDHESRSLASVAFIGHHPEREITAADAKFVEDSIKELEGDLPFRSLAVAIQPVGAPMPSDEELRTAVAPLVAANDVKALAAMWRGGAFPAHERQGAQGGALPDDRDHRHARSGCI